MLKDVTAEPDATATMLGKGPLKFTANGKDLEIEMPDMPATMDAVGDQVHRHQVNTRAVRPGNIHSRAGSSGGVPTPP